MCEHNHIDIWEMSKITVVDSNDVVNHWLMTGTIDIPALLSDKTLCDVTPEVEAVVYSPASPASPASQSVIMYSCISEHSELTSQ